MDGARLELLPFARYEECMSFTDGLLRVLLTGLHKAIRAAWFVRRPRTLGAHGLALTAGKKIVLVKLRYARGWRMPGGGRSASESAEAAVLRELREEIGLIDHGPVRLACELEQRIDFKRDLAALLIVEDVRYRPRKWSLEVERVCEFALDALPDDLAPLTRRWIEALRPHI